MSEIPPQPPESVTTESNSRLGRLGAASDQSTSNNQSAEHHPAKQAVEVEPEKQVSLHDPAVTLASTLSKLDTGSYFAATVEGRDADARIIIKSELGTYLVEAERLFAADIDKIKNDAVIELRVIAVGQEIKAEIIRPPEESSKSLKPILIPVSLTLTDLGQNANKDTQNPLNQTITKNTPLEDVRSQYGATTLYKAERIAREIGNKLDNLPFPTSSPNYTVFGLTEGGSLSTVAAPKQISANIFIQEVKSPKSTITATQQASATQLSQLFNSNIEVEVIKAIPKTDTPLPAGIPASVAKEINVLTPLDYVKVGQQFNMNIAAVAVPENNDVKVQAKAIPLANLEAYSAATPKPATTPEAPITQQATAHITPNIEQTMMSGIIIDNSQASKKEPSSQGQTQPTAPQKNEYFLATPTAVLKFKSNTPLAAGTIVNFTVSEHKENTTPLKSPLKNLEAALKTATSIAQSTETVKAPLQTETSSTNVTSQSPATPAPINITERIEHFMPQPLEDLTREWGTISLAMSALLSSSSMAMASVFASRIPNMQSPEQLTSSMFFFLSALKSTTPSRTWTGPEVATRLKQIGAGKIFEKMDLDFTRIARLSVEVPAGEWRPMLIPLQNGAEITAVPFLTKQIVDEEEQRKKEQDKNEKDVKVKATRFILEVTFSQFGTVTIDGMLRRNRLDMILKATKAVPFAIKMKLSRLFSDALGKNNFEGELVIIDNAPVDEAVSRLITRLVHNNRIEKKI